MEQKQPSSRLVILLGGIFLVLLALVFISSHISAQSGALPRLDHDACRNACMVDSIFLWSNLGDSAAWGAYQGWFDSYYELTGCGDSPYKTDRDFIIAVVGEFVDAPGAYTMQCWQGLMAFAHNCSGQCSDYFIPDAKFAPNLRLRLDSADPGYLEANISNQSHLEDLPELANTAYSRGYTLRTTLQLDGGTQLLIDSMDMPRLSFPNWITRGGISDCILSYGEDSTICQLISYYNIPSEHDHSVSFYDGGLYDLSDNLSNTSGVSGSFSQDGFVVLYSDGNHLTIEQGPYAGFAWTKTHNQSSGSHTQQLVPWDASNGAVTITNHECPGCCGLFCWGTETESDTYVFALQGPSQELLSGTYTVEITANITHDKDTRDNTASYSYDASAVTSLPGEEQEDDGQADTEEDQTIHVDDLPIIDLPGEGIYPNNMPEGVLGVMYRISIPENIYFQFVRIISNDGGHFNAFIRRDTIPVPDYPLVYGDYLCWAQATSDWSDGCAILSPSMHDYYIFVPSGGGTSFQIEVEWTTNSDAATAIAVQTQAAEQAEQEQLANTLSEVEDNESRQTANAWDMQGSFSGQIARWGDRDYVQVDIPQPGIYTFSLTDVSPDLEASLTLIRATNGDYLDTSYAHLKGESISLTFDGSAGEQYDLIIAARAVSAGATDMGYLLSLSSFVPDPYESNDLLEDPTPWDLLEQDSIQGYFWDKTTGRRDYYSILAPQTLDGGPIHFDLTNPCSDLRIRLSVVKPNGVTVAVTSYSTAGQPVSLDATLPSGQEYVLKLEVMNLKTCLQPYTLSASYTPTEGGSETTSEGHQLRLHGSVIRGGKFLPTLLRNVSIYAQVGSSPAILLATTNLLGMYSGNVSVEASQEVRTWAEKGGLAFDPAEDLWIADEGSSDHRVNFHVVGAQLTQQTPTPTPQGTGGDLPPLIQTALVTPTPAGKPTRIATPTLESTPPPPTPTLESSITVISGHAWRLFPDADPVGIGAARLILSVNGVDQPAVSSMIDGFYQMDVPGLQPGDALSLRAENPEDEFEPVVYNWQAEQGVDKWEYDFYSYWGTITPPASDDLNHIYGWVLDYSGHGVLGVTLTLRTGTSDAYQLMGPTDAEGYYEAYVQLPDRVMVTVWVNEAGFLPSSRLFFHPYAPEDRQVNFRAEP